MIAEYEDGSLSSWVNKERFQGYLQIDGFTLYELGETGTLYFLESFCSIVLLFTCECLSNEFLASALTHLQIV